jgi:DNA (cytosine-5)-methyltransferase 1
MLRGGSLVKFDYVSLFSGMGGFETALNRLGGRCLLSSEIDKWANLAYKILYGESTAGDVKKIDENHVPHHDVLVGGFPCQPFSLAGFQKGFLDTRGTLFFEIARIAKTQNPRLLLLENVKGLVNHDQGRTLEVILKELCRIGYAVDFNVLNSKDYGVPQSRERIYIACVLGGKTEPWHIAGKGLVARSKRRLMELGLNTFNFDWPRPFPHAVRLKEILEPVVDEKYYLSEEKTKLLLAQLDLHEYAAIGAITGELKREEEIRPILTPDRLQKRQRGRRLKTAGEESFTVTTLDRHGVAIMKVAHIPTDKGQTGAIYSAEGLSPTLMNVHGGAVVKVLLETRIRRLTPLECFRLQGFPDEYFYRLKQAGIVDTHLYKMAGNAVTVNVIEAISKRLLSQHLY